MHILMIEDDLDLGRALLQALKSEGITSEWVRRAADARLARLLERQDELVEFHVWPGGHDEAYWRAHLARYLRFYADACG